MSVCLVMIVKDEAHVVRSCLESVKPYIDTWSIVDTGSEDNTTEVITEALRGVPGVLHHRPWKDFGHNRSEAMALAKGTADYSLVIDADETLVVADPTKNPFEGLVEPYYSFQVRLGSTEYTRASLFKQECGWAYKGVIHEFPWSPMVYVPPSTLEAVHVISEHRGNRSRDPMKYHKDVEVLLRALETDYADDIHLTRRGLFYLAQSYRNIGEYELAHETYMRRTEWGGYTGEIFISYLEAAKVLEAGGKAAPTAVAAAYMKAHKYDPYRAEPLYYLARHYRMHKDFVSALGFAYAGLKAAKRGPDDLFTEADIYDWGLKDEYSLGLFYTGNVAEARRVLEELLESSAPEYQKARFRQNLRFMDAD